MPLEDIRLADRPQLEELLLDNVTGNTTGAWKPVSRRRPLHITIEGVGGPFSGTVTLYGSLQRTKPADDDTGRVLLQATTSAALSVVVDAPYAWVKATVSGYASGTIFSYCTAG